MVRDKKERLREKERKNDARPEVGEGEGVTGRVVCALFFQVVRLFSSSDVSRHCHCGVITLRVECTDTAAQREVDGDARQRA